jgi:hypothetical protein
MHPCGSRLRDQRRKNAAAACKIGKRTRFLGATDK